VDRKASQKRGNRKGVARWPLVGFFQLARPRPRQLPRGTGGLVPILTFINCGLSGHLNYIFQRCFLGLVEGEYVTGGEQRLRACANRSLRQGSSRS
jgi:hypothetical protein